MKLALVELNSRDPSLNLQYEEELKKRVNPELYLLRFWINTPCLVMGRFQREEFEVQRDFVKRMNIPVLRRSTGGGTVYHDEGTLNISFFKPKAPTLSDSKKDSALLVSWIAEALEGLGLEVTQDERNALFIGEKKILGSAVSLTGDVLLFHASLLVKTNLENLLSSIEWTPSYSEGGSPYVKSHRSPVINISDVRGDLTLEIIKQKIVSIFQTKLKPEEILNNQKI